MCDKVLAQDFKAHFRREVKKGFTLAEVLITLAIIGVVAAMTIPAVIVNTNQAEFKTGLRKAVSTLNSAITLNKALTGESPYDNNDLFNYLQQHMAVLKSDINTNMGPYRNKAFFTSDGMRYEFTVPRDEDGFYGPRGLFYNYRCTSDCSNRPVFKLYESNTYITIRTGNCGSMGLAHNPDGTTEPPCIIQVDVNGERKPSAICKNGMNDCLTEAATSEFIKLYKYQDAKGRLLSDFFSIMITDQGAIPYGIVAQKAMYQAQK